MSSQGDTRRRPRPVVTLVALVILVAGAFLSCPAPLGAAAAHGPDLGSTVLVAAHDHADHSSVSPDCGPDSDLLTAGHLRLVERNTPNPSFAHLAVQATNSLAMSAPVRPVTRCGVPDFGQRSGRVLLNDLVVARI